MSIPGFIACIISIKFLNEKYRIKKNDNINNNKIKELEEFLDEDKNDKNRYNNKDL